MNNFSTGVLDAHAKQNHRKITLSGLTPGDPIKFRIAPISFVALSEPTIVDYTIVGVSGSTPCECITHQICVDTGAAALGETLSCAQPICTLALLNITQTALPTGAPLQAAAFVDGADASIGLSAAFILLLCMEWILLFTGGFMLKYPEPLLNVINDVTVIAFVLFLATAIFALVIAATGTANTTVFWVGVLTIFVLYMCALGYIIVSEFRPDPEPTKEKLLKKKPSIVETTINSDKVAFFGFVGLLVFALLVVAAQQMYFGALEVAAILILLVLVVLAWSAPRMALSFLCVLFVMYAIAELASVTAADGWTIAAGVILLSASVGAMCWLWVPWQKV